MRGRATTRHLHGKTELTARCLTVNTATTHENAEDFRKKSHSPPVLYYPRTFAI